MNLDLSRDHRISLKRHDRKLWSYRDNKPDTVEAAVLDYLRDHGFDGYFTQRDNYLDLFKRLAGWPGRIFKRFPPFFISSESVYYGGADGSFPHHKFTFAEVMAEVERATLESLSEKLRGFCAGKPYIRGSFSTVNHQPDHMLSFLKAFSLTRLKSEIKLQFTEETLKVKRHRYEFRERAFLIWHKRNEFLTSKGLEKYATSLMPVVEKPDTQEWTDFLLHIKDPIIRDGELREFTFHTESFARATERKVFATLDLQLWSEAGTAIVEVKTPNDRLMQSQKNTIELARKAGERACLISVDEAN
jgi:hypothetical protein